MKCQDSKKVTAEIVVGELDSGASFPLTNYETSGISLDLSGSPFPHWKNERSKIIYIIYIMFM